MNFWKFSISWKFSKLLGTLYIRSSTWTVLELSMSIIHIFIIMHFVTSTYSLISGIQTLILNLILAILMDMVFIFLNLFFFITICSKIPIFSTCLNNRKVVEIESGGDASPPPHPPGSQMIFTYISLINRQKMEKSVKGWRVTPTLNFYHLSCSQ